MEEGSQSTVPGATFHLPLEIAIEILSRLPVKSLLRFKSVCKTWYALLKTPSFIAKHLLTHSTHDSPSLIAITHFHGHKTRNYTISLLSDDGLSGAIDFPPLTLKNYDSVSGPTGGNYLRVVGVCNGLVCISLSRFGYPLFLCNPSTRQFREIPGAEWNWEEENMKHVEQVSFGFGFHSSVNDYKLIRIVLYTNTMYDEDIRADLYVMSTGTWTRIDVNKLSLFIGEMNESGELDNIVRIDGFSAPTVLNGVFYWPARVLSSLLPTDRIVMSFDMGNEVFRKIRTPECLDGTWDEIYWQFTELDDKLALVVSRHESGFDVWVLNENESSWTNQIKGVSFPRISSDMAYGEDGECIVVGGRNYGELLVAEHKVSGDIKLCSYDTKTRQTKDLCFGHVRYESCLYLYTGTLLPVMQANEVLLN